jgi:hypothetical protein
MEQEQKKKLEDRESTIKELALKLEEQSSIISSLRSEIESFKSEDRLRSENKSLKEKEQQQKKKLLDRESTIKEQALKLEEQSSIILSLRSKNERLREKDRSLVTKKCNRVNRKRPNSPTYVNKNVMKKPVIKFVDNQLITNMVTVESLRPNPND